MVLRRSIFLLALVVALSLVLVACDADTPADGEPTPLKVGLVTDIGKVDDGTFNQYAHEGAQLAAEEFGLDYSYIETVSSDDYVRNIELFANEGFDVIITVGFLMGDTTAEMAARYPDINFAIVDFAYDPPIPNVMGLVFREDQAGFMAGALAGLMTETNVVGIVAGMEIPPVKKFRNGYEQGVAYVCPECRVIGVYIDSFTDPARGRTAAEAQMGEGADVIFGAGGPTGSGGILGAAQEGAWVIGVDQDEYWTTFRGGTEAGSDRLISSAMKRVDVSVYNAIRDAVLGQFEGGTALFEAANDGVGLAPFNEAEGAIPDDVRARLDEIFRMLADGTLDTGVDPVTGDMLP